jgi:AbrB family looped-hinge helix DNA binding protein
MDAKGRVTLPRELRRGLGLSVGDRVEFGFLNGRVFLRALRPETNVFSKDRGALGTFPGGQRQINVWMRRVRAK